MLSRLSSAWLARLLAASEQLLAEAPALRLTDKQRARYVDGLEKALDKLGAEMARRARQRRVKR